MSKECWKVDEGAAFLGFHEKSWSSTGSPAFYKLNEGSKKEVSLTKVSFCFIEHSHYVWNLPIWNSRRAVRHMPLLVSGVWVVVVVSLTNITINFWLNDDKYESLDAASYLFCPSLSFHKLYIYKVHHNPFQLIQLNLLSISATCSKIQHHVGGAIVAVEDGPEVFTAWWQHQFVCWHLQVIIADQGYII